MRVHFLGIGGSGASAAAAIAQAQGFEVTGCDKNINNEFTNLFTKEQLFLNHNPNHLASHTSSGNVNIDILAITPAILSLDPDNRELTKAKELGIEILTWQQFTGKYLMNDKLVIAICGTHGKSTTTAMVAKILEDANLNPTVLLGAIVPEWKTNYRIGGQNSNDRRYFVIEADEFNDNFLAYNPDIIIVTNIEMDHPEYFKDLNAYLQSFEKFLLKTKQTIIANLLDKNVAEVVKDVMKQSKVTALDFNKLDVKIDLQIPGNHNISNAKAAFQTALLLGVKPEIILKSLNRYTGVSRRFEYLGDFNGAKVFSDFGHHPTEIEKTIISVREKFPDKKIYLFYQPHMFSRTKALFKDFVKVFQNLPADGVVILDIYPSREKDTGIISSKELVEAINKESVAYSTFSELEEEMVRNVDSEDILFFMGAGDIDKFAREIVKKQLP